MLASLLPGFRQLRAPLFVGSIFFVVAWLAIGEALVPTPAGSTMLEVRLASLVDFAGRNAVLVALAATSYLLGTFFVVESRPFRPLVPNVRVGDPGYYPKNRILRRLEPIRSRLSDHWHSARNSWFSELNAWAEDQSWEMNGGLWWASMREDESGVIPGDFLSVLRDSAAPETMINEEGEEVEVPAVLHADETGELPETHNPLWDDPFDQSAIRDALARHVCTDGLIMLTESIRDRKPDLWRTFDQHRSEAELRYSLLLPATILVVTFSILGSPYFAFVLLAVVPLYLWALRAEKKSLQLVGIALHAGYVESSLVAYLKQEHLVATQSDLRLIAQGIGKMEPFYGLRERFRMFWAGVVIYFQDRRGNPYLD